MSDFHALLNEQIGHEFGAAQQYIAIAVWYDQQTMPRLADVQAAARTRAHDEAAVATNGLHGVARDVQQ